MFREISLKIILTTFLFLTSCSQLFASHHTKVGVGPNVVQNLTVKAPLSTATFEWSPWSPGGSTGQGVITYTLSENVNVTTASTLTFKISGATVSGAYGGENTPAFAFSGSATGAVTLQAGYASNLSTGTTYSTILSLSNLESEVSLSNLLLNAQSPSAEGTAQVTFTIHGAPSDQITLDVYVGSNSYLISTVSPDFDSFVVNH